MYSRILSRRSLYSGAAITTFAGAVYLNQTKCDEKGTNAAFVFIKPHANTTKTQALVSAVLKKKGIKVLEEGELTAETIDKQMLIDQHYYAIASKATILKPKDLPVPADKFEKEFGIKWQDALSKGIVYNALDACKYLNITADQLDQAWGPAQKVKLGGGFYCGKVEIPGKPAIYVFNGFFMAMRAKFVTPGTSIHYYNVEFDPATLKWADFRGKVLGPTDPKAGPADSLRGTILKDWKNLGLSYEPNVGDNGVHASASPFEGLAERMNWLHVSADKDKFGKSLIAAGINAKTIKEWSVDPQVKGKSLFDQLEDLDAPECIEKAKSLAK